MNSQISSKNDIQKVQRPPRKTDVENHIFMVVSSGTIVSGIFTCFASPVIGLSLIFLGSMVLFEGITGIDIT